MEKPITMIKMRYNGNRCLGIVGFISAAVLSSFNGCVKSNEPIPDFQAVRLEYEKKVENAASALSRDSANSDLVCEYASHMLDKLRFDSDASWTNWYFGPLDNRWALVDLARILSEALRRDSTSNKLRDLLGKVCFEVCRDVEFKGLEPYDELRRIGIDALKNLAESDSTRIDARLKIAVMSLTNIDSAEHCRQIIRGILDSHPDDGTAWFYLGKTYRRSELADDHLMMLTLYGKASKFGLDEPMSYVEIARAYWSENLYDHVGYRESIKNIPAAAKAFFFAGANFFLKKDQRRIDLCKKALELNPLCLGALIDLTGLNYVQGNVEEALSYYRRADQIDSNMEPWFWGLHEFYEHVIGLHPDNYRAYMNLVHEYSEAVLQGDSSKLQQTIDYCRRAVRLKPDLPYPYIQLGLLYGHQRMYEKADSAMEQATRLLTANMKLSQGDPYVQLGLQYGHRGLHQKAEAAFEKALQRGFFSRKSCNLIRVYFTERGDDSKLTAFYRKYLRSLEASGGNAGDIAWGYEQIRELDSAYAWYLRALKPDPFYKMSGITKSMAALSWRLGNYIWYGRYLRDYQSRNAISEKSGIVWNDAYVYLEIGKNWLYEKDLDHAKEAFEKAIAAGSRDGNLLLDAGIAFWDAGFKERAAESFRRAAKRGNKDALRMLEEMKPSADFL